MNIYIDEKKWSHSFLSRLIVAFQKQGHTVTSQFNSDVDIQLCSPRGQRVGNEKLVQRLDGVYYDTEDSKNYNKRNKSMKETLNTADGVIYQSAWGELISDNLLGKAKRMSAVIPNGIDSKETVKGRSTEMFKIIGVAKWRKHKRLKLLLEAYTRFAYSKKDTSLLVLGNLRDSVEDFELFKKNSNITHREESKDGVLDCMRESHLFVHPGFLDCCPNVLIEAMSCGLPIVTNNIGGSSEVALHSYKCSILGLDNPEYGLGNPLALYSDDVLYGDFDSYEEKVSRLVRILDEYYTDWKQGNWSCNSFPLEFDIENVAIRYINFFEEVMGI